MSLFFKPAASAIPDSVVMQYFATTWSQGDGTWIDDNGVADMSIIGDMQDGTLSDGAESIHADGTDDHGEITLPSQFEGSGLTAFSVEAALETTTTDASNLIGLRESGANQFLEIWINRDGGLNINEGFIAMRLTDSNGNSLRFGPSNNPNINDGSRHDISFIIHDSTANDAEIIIDGTSVSLTFSSTGGPSSFTTWGSPMQVWARNLDGSISNYLDAKQGAMRWHDQGISDQTIGDYS